MLTGAGCSTESAVPDYRGPQGAYNTGFKPMTHQQVGPWYQTPMAFVDRLSGGSTILTYCVSVIGMVCTQGTLQLSAHTQQFSI